MISKLNRFHTQKALNYTYKNGQVVRTPSLSLKYVANERVKSFRTSVVVSKKVSKSAVKRNRIRRRIYEDIRLMSSSIRPGHDFIISVYKEDLLTISHSELQQMIHSCFKRANLLI